MNNNYNTVYTSYYKYNENNTLKPQQYHGQMMNINDSDYEYYTYFLDLNGLNPSISLETLPETNENIIQLFDVPEFIPSISPREIIKNESYTYFEIQHILWSIIYHQTCSIQKLIECTNLNENKIILILNDLSLWGFIEKDKEKEYEYKLCNVLLSINLNHSNNALMLELQQKFGDFNFGGFEPHNFSRNNSIENENENQLILWTMINYQTCSIQRLMDYMNLDQYTIEKSLNYWNSMGLITLISTKYNKYTLCKEFQIENINNNPYNSMILSLRRQFGAFQFDENVDNTADILIKQEKIEKILNFHKNDKTKKKREKKKYDKECVICMDNITEYICIPCGHFCLCLNCKNKINHKCPICLTKCNVIKVFK